MPASDSTHDAVRNALVKDGWTITDDPFTLDYAGVSVLIDLAGERLVAAERGSVRIAVEIKTFAGQSPVRDYRDALGQFDLYRMMLEDLDPDRKLYIATSETAYGKLFGMEAIRRLNAKRPLPPVIVRIPSGEVVQWIG
jgi:hypothetical protein